MNESHWPVERDSELFSILERELERQNTTLQLIASENFTSPAVLEATGSVLTNKYSEGYPGKRYYGGNELIDQVEELARERAKVALRRRARERAAALGRERQHGRVSRRCSEPGDTVLGMRLDQGGHLTHGSPVNASGKLFRVRGIRRDALGRAHRFRRSARSGATGTPEADRGRRDGLSPHHRPATVPRRSPTR